MPRRASAAARRVAGLAVATAMSGLLSAAGILPDQERPRIHVRVYRIRVYRASACSRVGRWGGVRGGGGEVVAEEKVPVLQRLELAGYLGGIPGVAVLRDDGQNFV